MGFTKDGTGFVPYYPNGNAVAVKAGEKSRVYAGNSAPVKTGDNTPISFFVLLIAMTTVIMAYSGRKLRRRKKREYIYKKSIACKK